MGRYENNPLFRRADPGPRCPGCSHWRHVSNRRGDRACLYALDEHRRRGCPVSSCTKFSVKVEVNCYA